MKSQSLASTALLISLCLSGGTAIAAVYPNTNLKYRKVVRLNYNWKYNQGDVPAASGSSFNDASWQTVNLPHSATYSNRLGDESDYQGIVWYRKSFGGVAKPKTFLEFEGAMQAADVWLNGQSLGRHDNSGYTGFWFDATAAALSAQPNVAAVKLDNNATAEIPPGVSTFDFKLYSGLYRDVWLVQTDNLYIPYCSQKITTPLASAASAIARVRTTVKNEFPSAKNCTVTLSIRDSSGVEIQSKSLSASISASDSAVFDMTTAAIASPHLWSPETPYVYQVYTTVSADGTPVDDYYEEFGIRAFEWRPSNGFFLNGTRYELKGVNLHQFWPHVENAVPHSRFYKDVRFIKAAGFNAVRCSHYPRDPEFYRACDRLGLLLLVENPSWGGATYSYSTACWTRFRNCIAEMIRVGHNHPSIFAWSIFNEPVQDISTTLLKPLNDQVHLSDSTRPSCLATPGIHGNNHNNLFAQLDLVDVAGLNYTYEDWVGDVNAGLFQNRRLMMTEYDKGLDYWKWVSDNAPLIAGGFAWVFADYYAVITGMGGIVDAERVPKQDYFSYRQSFAGTASDYGVAGTATKIACDADLTQIQADGTDLSLVAVSLRDNAGTCISAAKAITFTLTGPATMFVDPGTKTTAAGRTAVVIRSTTQPGTITLTASAQGLTSGVATITSVAIDTSGSTPALSPMSRGDRPSFTVMHAGRFVTVGYEAGTFAVVSVADARGRIVRQWAGRSGFKMDTKTLDPAVYFISATGTAGSTALRLTVAR